MQVFKNGSIQSFSSGCIFELAVIGDKALIYQYVWLNNGNYRNLYKYSKRQYF